MKIGITGASGFIGSHVLLFLQKEGYTVFPHPRHGALPEGMDALLNFSGESLFGRWTEEKKQRIRESRVSTSAHLCDQILNLKSPPKIYICASAIGYYGERASEAATEGDPAGEGFLAELCQTWEGAADRLEGQQIRVVFCRFGLVMGAEGGALERLIPFFKSGMGGKLGPGTQITSWIALEDVVRGILHLLHHPELSGPINFVSPNPLSNEKFVHLLGKYLHKPCRVTIPEWMVSLALGEGKEMLLKSYSVKPKRLLESGFLFKYPTMEEYLKSLNLST